MFISGHSHELRFNFFSKFQQRTKYKNKKQFRKNEVKEKAKSGLQKKKKNKREGKKEEKREKGKKKEEFQILFGTDTAINALNSYSKIENPKINCSFHSISSKKSNSLFPSRNQVRQSIFFN